MAEVYVKVCGLVQLEQAAPLVATGVDAIGINLHPSSPRQVSLPHAEQLLAAVLQASRAAGRTVEAVALVAESQGGALIERCRELGFHWVQLHADVEGGEGGVERRSALARDIMKRHAAPPREAAGERAPSDLGGVFLAVGVGGLSDLAAAERVYGERVLLDAKVPGQVGGTGQRFDWRLAQALGARRRVILAGGLTEWNVSEAIHIAAPWGVDAASGVESSPGIKDIERCRAFVAAAKQAAAAL